MKEGQKSPPAIPLYGPAIHGVIAHGNLQEMKSVAAKADAWLHEHGDISAAIEVLKTEIARIEAKH
jgi:Domain of unknown function (DUF1843)